MGLKLHVALAVLASSLFTSITLQGYQITFGQFFDESGPISDSNSSGASNTTDLDSEESGLAEIVLLSQKLKKASFGYRDLIGQVKNIGNSTAESIKIHLSVYDKDAALIGSEYTYADISDLKPGQKSAFTIMSDSDNFKGMDYYEISLEWSNADSSQGYIENAQLYEDEK